MKQWYALYVSLYSYPFVLIIGIVFEYLRKIMISDIYHDLNTIEKAGTQGFTK